MTAPTPGLQKRKHYQCALCHRVMTDQERRPIACGACGGENTYNECPDGVARGAHGNLASVHLLSVPANVRRIKGKRLFDVDGKDVDRVTVHAPIDHVLGGSDATGAVVPGVAAGCAVRLEADKGAGKSTLMLQALGEVARRGPAVYGTGEESESAIRARAERLQIFSGPDGATVAENLIIVESPTLEDFLDEVKTRRPLLSVFDSAQLARSSSKLHQDTPANDPRMISYVATEVFNVSHALKTGVILLINQIVKDGTAAGPSITGFAVDMLLKLSRDEDHHEHDEALCPFVNARYLSCGKNRHGPETRRVRLAMTLRGLVAWETVYPAPVSCQQPAAPRRKRAAQSSEGSGA